MISKQTNAQTFMGVYYIHCIRPHVSAKHVAILREVYYTGYIYRDVTAVYEPIHRLKNLSFKVKWFKIHFKL
jgi:hypothetical protein